jgi:multicomponent Na+:H+ antiporter subunit G
MEMLIDGVSWACLLVGALMSVVGGIGILRLPDFYSRMHAVGITDTMGAGFVLVGLMFQAGLALALAKLIMILVFLLLTSPTSAHALAEAARGEGLEPLQHGDGRD